MAVELVDKHNTFPVSYKQAADVSAGDVLRYNTPGTNQYVQQMAVAASANDVTNALLAGVALRGSGGAVASDGAVTDDAYAVRDGELAWIDIDAGSGNTIARADVEGHTFDFLNAGYLDLTDTTPAVGTLSAKVLRVTSGVGSRYGKGLCQILYA